MEIRLHQGEADDQADGCDDQTGDQQLHAFDIDICGGNRNDGCQTDQQSRPCAGDCREPAVLIRLGVHFSTAGTHTLCLAAAAEEGHQASQRHDAYEEEKDLLSLHLSGPGVALFTGGRLHALRNPATSQANGPAAKGNRPRQRVSCVAYFWRSARVSLVRSATCSRSVARSSFGSGIRPMPFR